MNICWASGFAALEDRSLLAGAPCCEKAVQPQRLRERTGCAAAANAAKPAPVTCPHSRRLSVDSAPRDARWATPAHTSSHPVIHCASYTESRKLAIHTPGM
jgi:hypothetical protein